MIICASTGSGFVGALSYIHKERDKIIMEEQKPKILEENMVYGTISKQAQLMRLVANKNVRSSRPVLHLSVSFHQDEKVENKIRDQIFDKIFEELKVTRDNNQFVIAQHFDADHEHYHILLNKVGFDRSNINTSYIKNKCQVIADKIEIELDLRKTTGRTVVYDSKSKDGYRYTTKEERNPKKIFLDKAVKVRDVKIELHDIIVDAMQSTKSVGEFIKVLEEKGIDCKANFTADEKLKGISFRYKDQAYKGSQLGLKSKEIQQYYDVKESSKIYDVPENLQNHANTENGGVSEEDLDRNSILKVDKKHVQQEICEIHFKLVLQDIANKLSSGAINSKGLSEIFIEYGFKFTEEELWFGDIEINFLELNKDLSGLISNVEKHRLKVGTIDSKPEVFNQIFMSSEEIRKYLLLPNYFKSEFLTKNAMVKNIETKKGIMTPNFDQNIDTDNENLNNLDTIRDLSLTFFETKEETLNRRDQELKPANTIKSKEIAENNLQESYFNRKCKAALTQINSAVEKGERDENILLQIFFKNDFELKNNQLLIDRKTITLSVVQSEIKRIIDNYQLSLKQEIGKGEATSSTKNPTNSKEQIKTDKIQISDFANKYSESLQEIIQKIKEGERNEQTLLEVFSNNGLVIDGADLKFGNQSISLELPQKIISRTINNEEEEINITAEKIFLNKRYDLVLKKSIVENMHEQYILAINKINREIEQGERDSKYLVEIFTQYDSIIENGDISFEHLFPKANSTEEWIKAQIEIINEKESLYKQKLDIYNGLINQKLNEIPKISIFGNKKRLLKENEEIRASKAVAIKPNLISTSLRPDQILIDTFIQQIKKIQINISTLETEESNRKLQEEGKKLLSSEQIDFYIGERNKYIEPEDYIFNFLDTYKFSENAKDLVWLDKAFVNLETKEDKIQFLQDEFGLSKKKCEGLIPIFYENRKAIISLKINMLNSLDSRIVLEKDINLLSKNNIGEFTGIKAIFLKNYRKNLQKTYSEEYEVIPDSKVFINNIFVQTLNKIDVSNDFFQKHLLKDHKLLQKLTDDSKRVLIDISNNVTRKNKRGRGVR